MEQRFSIKSIFVVLSQNIFFKVSTKNVFLFIISMTKYRLEITKFVFSCLKFQKII